MKTVQVSSRRVMLQHGMWESETLILLRLKQIHKGRKLKDGDKHDGLNLLFLIKILTANEGSYKQPHLDGLYDY